jgi:hypothetical protein
MGAVCIVFAFFVTVGAGAGLARLLVDTVGRTTGLRRGGGAGDSSELLIASEGISCRMFMVGSMGYCRLCGDGEVVSPLCCVASMSTLCALGESCVSLKVISNTGIWPHGRGASSSVNTMKPSGEYCRSTVGLLRRVVMFFLLLKTILAEIKHTYINLSD